MDLLHCAHSHLGLLFLCIHPILQLRGHFKAGMHRMHTLWELRQERGDLLKINVTWDAHIYDRKVIRTDPPNPPNHVAIEYLRIKQRGMKPESMVPSRH